MGKLDLELIIRNQIPQREFLSTSPFYIRIELNQWNILKEKQIFKA